jgi:hypothetical protein
MILFDLKTLIVLLAILTLAIMGLVTVIRWIIKAFAGKK